MRLPDEGKPHSCPILWFSQSQSHYTTADARNHRPTQQPRICNGKVGSAPHRDHLRSEPYPEEWLLIEWPKGEAEPTKYWLSTLPPQARLSALVRLAKHLWIIERDYQELKQELGLGHYEGRGWQGFHHHATLCIAAYGFLVIARSRFSPSARAGGLELRSPRIPSHFQPRGSPRARRTA
jgi:SRSO17 transposase